MWLAGQTIDRPAIRVQRGARIVKSVHMAGPARQIPPDRPPGRMNCRHVVDLYGVYISLKRMTADTGRMERPFAPVGRQVLHKVIHRLRAALEALLRRAAHGARLAGRDAGALEWRARRHAERAGASSIAAHCASRPAMPSRFIFHLTFIVRRTALMLAPRIAPSSFTPPSGCLCLSGAPVVCATCP
ncbi:hypothetical protein B0G80_2523 [Paraburkholderia sp. BL6669N2]|nr:hypothetical protein B0G80_2523 [Paraburkholderia sp. BL6669N2]